LDRVLCNIKTKVRVGKPYTGQQTVFKRRAELLTFMVFKGWLWKKLVSSDFHLKRNNSKKAV